MRGRLDTERVAELRNGLKLEDGRTEPAQVRMIATNREQSVFDLTIHEGKNRQVRRMLEQLERPGAHADTPALRSDLACRSARGHDPRCYGPRNYRHEADA